MGLLDLPAELLHRIFSFLGTLSLASVRLTCRTLHQSATSGRHLVTLELKGLYTAKARASPRVLTLAHTFETLLARLKDAGHEGAEDLEEPSGLGPLGNHRTPAWLRAELLAGVAQDVESFCIASGWKVGADQPEAGATNPVLFEPHACICHDVRNVAAGGPPCRPTP